MIKKALIIVPHQDDELNCAGPLFGYLNDANCEVSILFTTKGDYYKKNYETRMVEMRAVQKLLGIDHIHVLDYHDDYNYKNHKFNNYEERIKIKNEIKQIVVEENADFIVCVDYDLHADHRMTSVLFDEIMHDLMVERDYRPIVFKKFAYLGVWGGVADYFSKDTIPTLPRYESREVNIYYECLPYSWDDRIQIKTRDCDNSILFWRSKLFSAYIKYYTQCGVRAALRTINADSVYWYRNTNNLAIGKGVTVTSSSGNASYINDFKIANISEVSKDFSGVNRYSDCTWIPELYDNEKIIKVSWNDNGIDISSIKVFQNYREIGHIKSFIIEMSNGFSKKVICSDNDIQEFTFDRQSGVEWLSIKIDEYDGYAGIRELEVYQDASNLIWDELPFKEYHSIDKKNNAIMLLFAKIVYELLWICFRLKNKVRKKLKIACW